MGAEPHCMRRLCLVVAATFAFLLACVGTVVAIAASAHPDSRTASIEDGCNRSQLALLGEAAATMEGGPHPTGFASWVYVGGDSKPKTVEGTVLGTHTAGTDLFGVHDTYDVNFDVAPDAASDALLSTRNEAETIPQIHTEWESGLAPLFAWPSPGDHVRETGSQIWDCGHWQDGEKTVPSGDLVPGDPLGSAGNVVPGDPTSAAGIKPAAGEEIEIHPIMELATWRAHGDFVPQGRPSPVHAAQLDVAISNQGGKAKGIEECALLAPAHPSEPAKRLAANPTCSTRQDVTGRDYVYRLAAPGPKPSHGAKLRIQQDLHPGHAAPTATDVRLRPLDGAYEIVVPFARVARADGLQDFGGTWHVWWSSSDRTPLHHFRVTHTSVKIFNNLDGDSGDTSGNPLISPAGEWNLYTDVAGHWTNMHDPRGAGHPDYAPALGAVPSAKSTPQLISLAAAPAVDVSLPDDAALHLFTDARECDQPGYVDCPTAHDGVQELASTGRSSGRGEITLPVAQLAGHTTTVVLHPHVCGTGSNNPCTGEEQDPVSLCGATSCYAVTFQIEDAGPGATSTPLVVSGDGTAGATLVSGVRASTLPWWTVAAPHSTPDELEEYGHVATVVAGLRAASR